MVATGAMMIMVLTANTMIMANMVMMRKGKTMALMQQQQQQQMSTMVMIIRPTQLRKLARKVVANNA